MPATIDAPAADLWAQGDRQERSSVALDEYHRGLLWSENDEDLLLGIASITFWGYASGAAGRFTLNRALGRTRMLVCGNGPLRQAQSREQVISLTHQVRMALNEGDRARAIQCAMNLKFFGLPFASKLLAFLKPETECVFDSVIAAKLNRTPALRRLYIDVRRQGRSDEKAKAYARWAEFCTKKARALNAAGSQWTDWNGNRQRWRAIDVERAIYGQ